MALKAANLSSFYNWRDGPGGWKLLQSPVLCKASSAAQPRAVPSCFEPLHPLPPPFTAQLPRSSPPSALPFLELCAGRFRPLIPAVPPSDRKPWEGRPTADLFSISWPSISLRNGHSINVWWVSEWVNDWMPQSNSGAVEHGLTWSAWRYFADCVC